MSSGLIQNKFKKGTVLRNYAHTERFDSCKHILSKTITHYHSGKFELTGLNYFITI